MKTKPEIWGTIKFTEERLRGPNKFTLIDYYKNCIDRDKAMLKYIEESIMKDLEQVKRLKWRDQPVYPVTEEMAMTGYIGTTKYEDCLMRLYQGIAANPDKARHSVDGMLGDAKNAAEKVAEWMEKQND